MHIFYVKKSIHFRRHIQKRTEEGLVLNGFYVDDLLIIAEDKDINEGVLQA